VARGQRPIGGAGDQHAHGCEHGAYSLEFDARPGFVAGVVVATLLLRVATLALLLTLLRV
jgi:hypothetical protein